MHLAALVFCRLCLLACLVISEDINLRGTACPYFGLDEERLLSRHPTNSRIQQQTVEDYANGIRTEGVGPQCILSCLLYN